MPKDCTLCHHPDRENVNKALEAKLSNRAASERFGVSKSAVDRHRRNCLPGIKARAREIRVLEKNMPALEPTLEPSEQSPFIQRVEDHTTKLELLRDAAIRNNDDKVAIAAAREVRGAYEVLGKATGKFQPMFGPPEHQPMFQLAAGLTVNVTVSGNKPQDVANDDCTIIEHGAIAEAEQ